LLVEVAAMPRITWLWIAAIVLLSWSESRGEGLPSASEIGEPSAERITAWIEQLDRPAYGERQAASQQLENAGAAALAHLEATVSSGSREASGRALDVLKRHFQRGSDDVKLAARETLARLAENPNASTAQRARDILKPPATAATTTPIRFQPAMQPRINVFGGAIPANPAAFRRVSVSEINGRRIVEIDDRERLVIMEVAPGGGITVEIADKQNPRNPKRRLDAKDLAELKRKDAELGRLYEQHGGATQRLPGPFGAAAPFGIRALPLMPGGQAIRPVR
jgi:hypothetical protein